MCRIKYNELNQYAGTWSAEDEEIFLEATKTFDIIDEEIWEE